MRKLLIILCLVTFFSGCRGIKPPKSSKPVTRTMTITGYCKCGKCCGWKRNWLMRPVYTYGAMKGKPKRVGLTASGKMARPGTIAADTSKYPFGTVMYIEGYGYGKVQDRGGKIKGHHIDLFFSSHKQALKWGKQKKKVKVWVVKKKKK